MVENKEDCVFCKIASGEIPCYKIYETKGILAFLDINPVAKGHVLVIPKKHFRWIWDMPAEEHSNLMKEVYFVAHKLRKAFDTDWVIENIVGFDMPHSHVHLCPRTFDDGLDVVPTKPLDPKLSEEEMREIFNKIKKEF
jgi:histidine triad (HIT) family protein